MKYNPLKENKPNFIRIRNFGASNDILKKVKTQCTKLEKMFANHIAQKGLYL